MSSLCTSGFLFGGLGVAEVVAAESLPSGVKVAWDLEKAHRETTPTRERVCLNGLWCWQPAKDGAESLPADGWGYFKVPGFWAGNSNYIQEDCQTLPVHSKWKEIDPRGISAAWSQREITIPERWSERRIALYAELRNPVTGRSGSEFYPTGCGAYGTLFA